MNSEKNYPNVPNFNILYLVARKIVSTFGALINNQIKKWHILKALLRNFIRL